MITNRKQEILTSYLLSIKIFFAIAVCVITIFFVIGELIFPDERDIIPTDCRMFEADWYQVLENGEKVPIEVPGNVPAEYGEVVTLTTTLPQNIHNHENLCFRVIWQDVAIYIDGELRQSYSTKDSRPFGTNSALRYIFVELYETDAGKELIYEFSSNSKYAGEIRQSYIGDRTSIWFHFLSESGVRTIISLLLMLLSLFCIIVCVILKYLYKKDLSLNYLAWTLFFCALWMLSETEFRQLIFKNVSILSNYTYWSLMLIPVPLLIYINDVQKKRYEKLYLLPLIYSEVILIIGTLLQVFDIVQFVEQLPFIHGGIAIAILCIIGTITIDVFKKRISDYLFVGIGLYGMLFSAIVEMILYYVDSPVSIGTVLSVGLLFLLIMAIIKTGQDLFISEQKKQQAIMATKAQAQFLASMSHEIRTPINAVIGMNEMILRENENETIQKYAHNIQRSSNLLLGLVNNVLDFSKIESGQLELVEGSYHLATLIQDEMLLLNARVTGKAISTQIDIDSNLPSKLFGDELRIKQVLTNLISNAVKYTKEGSVTLKVSFQELEHDTIMLCFSVTDTGIGIKKEDLPKLFDSFKRLEMNKNRNIEGTGLGLNIVKSIVKLMQGTITVDSVYGTGSTFTIAIPQKVMDSQAIGNLEDVLKDRKRENENSTHFFTAPDASVLIVDDNDMNLSVVKALLKRTNIQLDFAKSGKECLEITKNKSYDIILMDHMMPEMDGIETLQLLRKDDSNPNQNAIVIALTANAIAGCREMYLEQGFNDYFSKPIQADKLDELLIHYLPEILVHMDKKSEPEDSFEMKSIVTTKCEELSDLLIINHDMGVAYCGDSEEVYKEILKMFCEQCPEYLAQLEKHLNNCDWKQYAIVAHTLKGNSLNIGAANFSKLSLQHEIAGKEENAAFIKAEYAKYVAALNKLVEKIKG